MSTVARCKLKMSMLDRIAMDQRRKAGGADDTTELSSFLLEPSVAGTARTGLRPGEFVAADVAHANRGRTAYKF